jgi:hypothetical protein
MPPFPDDAGLTNGAAETGVVSSNRSHLFAVEAWLIILDGCGELNNRASIIPAGRRRRRIVIGSHSQVELSLVVGSDRLTCFRNRVGERCCEDCAYAR